MSLAIDRRAFLRLAALGLPSAVIAEKMGLAEKSRSYFFAPRAGWAATGYPVELTSMAQIEALEIEAFMHMIPELVMNGRWSRFVIKPGTHPPRLPMKIIP